MTTYPRAVAVLLALYARMFLLTLAHPSKDPIRPSNPRTSAPTTASRSRTLTQPPPTRHTLAADATGSLHWPALAQCESSRNPGAVSSSGRYRGLYQFDLPTWRSVGGAGDPAAASPTEQTLRAQLLYNVRGRAPWPICGRHL
jgi:hypothetical protein